MSKGPPPAIKPKPRGLPPVVGRKPEIDIGNNNNINTGSSTSKAPLMSSSNASMDDEFITSLRGGLRKSGHIPYSGDGGLSPRSSGKAVNQSVIDSVVSKPISLTYDTGALDSDSEENEDEGVDVDEDEHETPRLSPASARNEIFHSGTTPFKNSATKSFPPPPQRNNKAIAASMASPLKKVYHEPTAISSRSTPPVFPSGLEKTRSRETIDYAEGMRSPLKKNLPSSFPPPPRRNASKTSYKSERDAESQDDASLKPPSLPARRTNRRAEENVEDSGDDNSTPALPARNRPRLSSRDIASPGTIDDDNGEKLKSRRSPERHDRGPHHTSGRHSHDTDDRGGDGYDDDDDGYYGDESSRPRHRSGSTRKSSAGHRSQGHRDDGYSSSEDDQYGNPKSLRRERKSSTSLFLNNAKSFSKDSYHAAREKSAPFAKQAMGGLNKMKDRLKSSINKEEDDYSEDSDGERYRRRSERTDTDDKYSRRERRGRSGTLEKGSRDPTDPRYSRDHRDRDHVNVETYNGYYEDEARPRKPERPQRPDRPNRSDRSETPESVRIPSRPTPPRRTESEESDTGANYDVSVDEDRPSLPLRRNGAARTQTVGIPLPGLTADSLKPVQKAKPPVPIKDKPKLPPKKANLLRNVSPDATLVTPKPTTLSAPPTRRLVSNSSVTSSTPPPAPPSRNKAPLVPPPRNTAAWKEPKINFELSTLWFMSDDLSNLPRDLQGLDLQCSHGFVGTKEFKIFAFRLRDLATLKVKLVWKKGSAVPIDTLSEEVEFMAPPVATKAQLMDGNEKYGEHIANWCEVKEGQTVGDGECWTLAHDALEKACGRHAFISSGLTHGALIATFVGKDNTIPAITLPPVSDAIRRGDILQFKSCVFQYPRRTMSFGSPDHTAIVLDVKESDDADKDGRLKWLEIIHQNMAGVKKVRVSDIDLGRLSSGELRVFRPVDAEWITDLSEVVI